MRSLLDDIASESPIVYVAGSAGLSYRCRRLTLTDLPVAERVTGLASIVDAQSATAGPAVSLDDARAALDAARASGDPLAVQMAEGVLSTAVDAARDRVRTATRDLLSDSRAVDGLLAHRRIWVCASVTGIARTPEGVRRGEMSADVAAGVTWDDVRLVPRVEAESVADGVLWVGRIEGGLLDGDAALVQSLTRWGAAFAGARFPRVERGDAPTPDSADVRGPAVGPALHSAE